MAKTSKGKKNESKKKAIILVMKKNEGGIKNIGN